MSIIVASPLVRWAMTWQENGKKITFLSDTNKKKVTNNVIMMMSG